MPKRREMVLAGISTMIAVAGVLLFAEIVLRFLPVADGIRSVPAVTDANPIFHLTPNRAFVYSRGWDFDLVNRGHVNNAGFVNDQDYRKDSGPPVLAVIGDSYIEGLMVPFAETVQGRLSKALSGKLRVYSFAASGAPLSQYLIWAQHAVREFGAVALVVNVVGNDFDESHAAYKQGDGFWYYAPDAAGNLQLRLQEYRPGQFRELASYSALARYLFFNVRVQQIDLAPLRQWFAAPSAPPVTRYAGNTAADPEAGRVAASLAVIDAFFRDLPAFSGLPPERVVLTVDGFRYPEAAIGGKDTYFDRMRRALIDRAAIRGYEVIDLDPDFFADYGKNRRRFEFPRDGHWNAAGHGVAADAVLRSRLLRRLEAP